jgi:putative heme-binding domain-containing protein
MNHQLRYLSLTLGLVSLWSGTAVSAESFNFQKTDVVALTGGSNMERTRLDGWLHAYLLAAHPDLKVRNFGWEGDTVFEQWRDDGTLDQLDAKRRAAEQRIQREAGSTSWRQQRDWRSQLDEVGASVVIAQFGQMESLAGPAGLERFTAAYDALIADFAANSRRVLLIAPVPFEKDLAANNTHLSLYTQAIQELAQKRNLPFIALTPAPDSQHTDNGFQLNAVGQKWFAAQIVTGLGLRITENEALRREVIELERLWFDYWRPMNWAFLYGDRTNVPYSKDWRDSSQRIFPQEMNDFLPLLEQAQANVKAALNGSPIQPITARSSIPEEAPSVPPQTPEQELATFKIMDGFEVNLFASEADGVVKPIQMRWDERGRLWVACAVSYPQIKPGERANDYVLVCEDTDGDGRADHFHKFVEGLFMPSGLELGDGGLYVAQGTELLHFKDTNGDGRADVSKIVLGGFGTADSHQMINCINWGYGGELWFTQGHHIYSRVETPYGVETLNRAGIWRYRPRSGHLDPFFHWSSAGANCWGVVTTPDGQPFHKSGANIGSYYSTPGLIRSNLAVDAQIMNLCMAPIKQVGMEFLHSSHFPPEMQGRVLIGGYYANLLEWHTMELKDGIYQTTRLPNIIETDNTVFRPVEVRMGADGAIYVADWYNPIIGHYQASYRHPDRDKAHGRIWRVSWKGGPLQPKQNLAESTTEDLLNQLDSPERWTWYQARRLLFEKDPAQLIPILDSWWPTQTPFRQLQALALYEAHDRSQPDLLQKMLRATEPNIRAYATRVLGTWTRLGKLPDPLALLKPQLHDPDPLVRLEAIVAASYHSSTESAALAASTLDHEFNGYHQHALTKTLHVLSPWWATQPQFEKDAHHLFALQNSWVEDPNTNRTRQQASAIMKEKALQATTPEDRRLWLQALAKASGPADQAFLLEQATENPDLLAAIQSAAPDNAAALLKPLFESPNNAIQQQALRLAGLWKVEAYLDAIRQKALTQKTRSALDAWISLRPNEVVKHTLDHLDDEASARPLLEALVLRTEGLNALQRNLEKADSISPDQAKATLRLLHLIGRNDERLTQPLMQRAGISAGIPIYSKATITYLVKTAQSIGNAAEGKVLYETIGCIACHKPGAANSDIGPDLSALARGLPIDMIVTELIWPSLNVKEGYEAITVTLKDNSILTGFKHTETADTLAIREISGNIRQVAKTDTQKTTTGGSLMPDTLILGLDETQLAHLIKYLSELGKSAD